jgi:C1A family cysteine protease
MRSPARYGWIPDRPDKRDLKFNGRLTAEIQTTPDWSVGMPPAFDQGQIGSCTGNMFGAEAFYLRRKQQEPAVMPSRLFAYWVAREREGSTDSDAGAQIRDVIAGAITQGICPETLWPYNPAAVTAEPSAEAFAQAQYCEVLDYQRVDNTNEEQLIAAMLIGPLCLGATIYDSFESATVARTGLVPMPDFRRESVVGGHALWLCQLDLVRRLGKIRNSWGPGWGQKGYCWFPLDYLTDGDLVTDVWLVTQLT